MYFLQGHVPVMGHQGKRYQGIQSHKFLNQYFFLLHPDFNHHIQMVFCHISGLCLIVLAVFFHYLHNPFLAAVIFCIYHQHQRGLPPGISGKKKHRQCEKHGTNQGYHGKACPADNPHADRPEKKNQVQRLLNRRAEPHNGQCAYHTQGYHNIRLYRKNHGGGNQCQGNKRQIKIFIIK